LILLTEEKSTFVGVKERVIDGSFNFQVGWISALIGLIEIDRLQFSPVKPEYYPSIEGPKHYQ
jgi:hypothetical protein